MLHPEDGYRRPTNEEFRELVKWAIARGLLKRAEPPPPPPPKDISPDLKKALGRKRLVPVTP